MYSEGNENLQRSHIHHRFTVNISAAFECLFHKQLRYKKTGVTNLSSYTSSIYVNLMMLIPEQE